jgi:2-polyprenyl-6-methoxyphenol hydroxylase-like FAD-dependent oxidoreductase
MTRNVEIIGAGLAGLVAATRFAQLGWHVSLHERSQELRMFGAGIWLWESGLKTLSVLGAFEQATARARNIKEWRVADRHGNTLMCRPMTSTDRMLLPPRADLYQALIDRARMLGVDIHTSSVVTGVKPEGEIILENGTQSRADLVLIANGAYSVLREQILATAWMDFGIEVGIRMLIDQREGDPTEIITEYWDGAWRLLFNPCTSGENYIFLGAPLGDDRARRLPVDRELWKERFPHASGLIDRFAEAGRWDRLVNVRCRHWSEGRVAIIGDAAHAMPPNLGQAANTAFINIMALAALLEIGGDIPATLREWETKQRPLSDHVQWWSYLYGFVVGKWPANYLTLRSDAVRALSRTEWFDHSLNLGARHVPAGYEGAGVSAAAVPPRLPVESLVSMIAGRGLR